jgi:CDP-diacylglycerol--serine O-phosphatidyltransferase
MMDSPKDIRQHRRRRFRRRGRRAYIRSVYFLPSMATLGNAICGFAAMYIAGLAFIDPNTLHDDWTRTFAVHAFKVAAYLIFLAMLFDALDGRLARFTRHTTDFGGQLDSLADVISFGAAPAFLALQLFRFSQPNVPVLLSRLIWAIGALFMSCAAMRLARFNVSNEHGEQHHFSFLGLPSPGAGGTVAAFILMQQDLASRGQHQAFFAHLSSICIWLLPLIVLLTGLLMVSAVRYPHFVNRYLRGKRSMGRLLLFLAFALLVIVAHQYVLAFGTLAYTLWGLTSSTLLRRRPTPPPPPSPTPL